MTDSDDKEIELKARIPKALMERIKTYQHKHQLDKRKQAVIQLIEAGLSAKFDGTTDNSTK